MRDQFLGGFLVLLGAISFGILSNIVKTAYHLGYTVGQVTIAQTFFGMVILWILYFIFQSRIRNNASKKTTTIKILNTKIENTKVILSGICPGLVGILYYKCVEHVPASIAIILLMQYLWMSVLIDFLVFKQKPTQLQIIAVIVIILGSVLAAGLIHSKSVSETSTNEQYDYITGYIFGFLAALANCLFLIVSNRVGNQLPALKKSALMISGAFILTFVIFPPFFVLDYSMTDKIYLFGIVLALFGTVIPPYLYSVGIPKVGLSISAILTAIELPVAVCASYFYLKEQVTFLQWIGVIIILCAIAMANLKFTKK